MNTAVRQAPEHRIPERQATEHKAGRNNLQQLVQLRWLAVAGQLLTILVVHYALGIALPLGEMMALLAGLAWFNSVCWLRCHTAPRVGDAELAAGLLVDVAVLGGQLYFSGGVTNPFVFLFLLQVAVASVLLRPAFTWALVAAASVAFAVLTQWHRPLALPGVQQAVLPPSYVGGLLLCFLLVAVLLAIFIVRIARNLRQRDARLADLRQRAAEEEHIVRMGLLATGAAHELGTPLATLSVILGDWARMAPFAGEPELRDEIEEMQRQLARCKTIVGGILRAAGESRGEAPAVTTLHAFLDELAADWARTRGGAAGLSLEREGLADMAIVSDYALQQMIDSVLDNAHEAAPDAAPVMQATVEDEVLVLRVRDAGPGFAPAMLERFGKPYQSSKGRPGGGLGLFLAVNVVRSLGGRIEARNLWVDGGAGDASGKAEGAAVSEARAVGAEVTIRLPLAAMAAPAPLPATASVVAGSPVQEVSADGPR